jgi:WD40 repeat protein
LPGSDNGVSTSVPCGVPGYEILGELGRGGMGVVYKARQVGLGRLVALKMILAGGHAGTGDLNRFRTEAQAIARLQHPNIVAVHEVGEHDGKPFFSLEFCTGGSLDRKLAGSPLKPAEAARLTELLARAMQAAHQANIIHRDLKPANVLLTEDGTPKITDFGLAKKLDGEPGAFSSATGVTQTGAVMGTPSYMAPEQAEGKKDIGPPADIYALGAILYELLTGRPPFKAATILDTLMQVAADEPVAPRRLNAKVPADLETISLKCLHKDPKRRYGSAEELAEDVGRWQRGEPIRARPVGSLERVAKWARRRPAVAGLLLVIVVLTGVAVAVITGLYRQAVWQAGEATREAGRAHQAETKAQTEKAFAEKQRERAEWLLYASRLQAAQREWEVGRADLAWPHLNACRWDYRGPEYRYLTSLLNRNQITLQGHSGGCLSVAISADGQRIVSGSASGGAFVRTPGAVKVWDATTGQVLLTLTGPQFVNSVAISADGQRIVGGGWSYGVEGRPLPGEVKVWDGVTGQNLLTLEVEGHLGTVTSVAVSADGKRIFGCVGNTVKVWDSATGTELLTLKGHATAVRSLTLSPDGKRIVTGSNDKTLKVWDVATTRVLLTLAGHTSHICSVAISPDGKRIVSGSWGSDAQGKLPAEAKVWDAATGQELLTLTGHAGAVNSVAFSADGKRIVSGSRDSMVKIWDAATGQVLLTLQGHRGGVWSVAAGADGKYMVSGGDDTVKVWDLPGPGLFTRKADVNQGSSVAISPDGKRIVSGSSDRTVKLWDADTGQVLLTLTGHTSAVTSVPLSPDGKRIVSGSGDCSQGKPLPGEVKVWDAASGQVLHTFPGHAVRSVAFSPDGKRIVVGSAKPFAAAAPGEVKVWDAASGQELLTLEVHAGWVLSVAISPDGKRIVSASGGLDAQGKPFPGELKVCDAATGQELLILRGGTAQVWSVAISPDGKRIVSGSGDGTVKVWDAVTGEQVLFLSDCLERFPV